MEDKGAMGDGGFGGFMTAVVLCGGFFILPILAIFGIVGTIMEAM